MSNIDKSMSQILDMSPLSSALERNLKTVQEEKEITHMEDEGLPTCDIDKLKKEEEDFEEARKILKELAEKGMGAVDELSATAAAAESNRGYEVMADMIKSVHEVAQGMMDLHKKKKDLSGQKSGKGINVDKAVVFTGGASDLLNHIKNNDSQG